MKVSWGWRPARPEGVWKHGCRWAKPFTAAAPWITLALLLALFGLVEGRLTSAPGVIFDLPKHTTGESAVPGLMVVVVPVMRQGSAMRETLVLFDDARYSLMDDVSVDSFRERLSERAAADATGTLLVLADARISAGQMMLLADIAREAGVSHVQFAEKRE